LGNCGAEAVTARTSGRILIDQSGIQTPDQGSPLASFLIYLD
jgi:hypothetical protein